MTSTGRAVGGERVADPAVPCGVGERTRDVDVLFFGGGSHRGGRGADEGESPRAFRSPWISRLRPPERGPSLFLPAAEWDATAAAPQSVRFRGAVPTHVLLTRARSPATDPKFSSRLLCRDAPLAAASSSRRMLLQQRVRRQQREAEAEQGNGREAARDEREGYGEGHGNSISAGFGPFQVGARRARFLLANRAKVARVGSVRGLVEGAAESERGEGLLLSDEGGRVSAPPERGPLGAAGGERCGCRPWETSLFPQSDTLFTSPNTGIANNTGSVDAAGFSQTVKTNQWLHRHRRGESSGLLDCYPASPPWPVGKGSTMSRRVSGLCAGPQGLIGGAPGRRLPDQHTQGASYGEYTDDMATTRTFHAPLSSEAVQQQLVIKSSFWNIERVERTHVLPSLHPKLALGKGACRKRILDPDVPVLPQSQRLRMSD